MTQKFQLGRTLATPGALDALTDAGQNPADVLSRHCQGDWGDLCDEDRWLNEQALIDGSRLLSSYTMLNGTKLWIITEASDNDGNRAATTILLPSEY